ncbi:MAG: isocitrate lyase/phosphoenolpyruvate mutase family protein [Bacteroidota bacterium]
MTAFEKFKALHYSDSPLLIGNAWDVTSATIFEQCGLKAIATSSRAIANSMGYEDGEKIPFDLLLQTVKRIAGHIHVPFSVDIEAGFSRKIPGIVENIERIYDLGAAGFNIEDSLTIDGAKLQPAEDFQKIISSIADHLAKKNMHIYMNVRTDAFLLKVPGALAETVTRIKMYERAGASGIFVPFVADTNDIRKIVETVSLPLNVLATAGLPGIPALRELGVKRISMGSSMHIFLQRVIRNAIDAIEKEQSLAVLFS